MFWDMYGICHILKKLQFVFLYFAFNTYSMLDISHKFLLKISKISFRFNQLEYSLYR